MTAIPAHVRALLDADARAFEALLAACEDVGAECMVTSRGIHIALSADQWHTIGLLMLASRLAPADA